MNNYSILWLDDVSKEEEIKEAEEKFPVSIKYIPFIDLCAKELEEHPERYDAVIFDANNQNSSSPGSPQTADTMGFLPLVEETLKKGIEVYVFSGELNFKDGDPALEMLSRWKLIKKDKVFENNGSVDELFEKIIHDLKSKNNLYVGFDYLLEIFRKKWIEKKYKTEFLDPLMEKYHQKDYDSAHGNEMRNITEQMLLRVNKEWALDTTKKEDDEGRYKKIVEQIKQKKLDDSSFVIGPLFHMIEITNGRSHKAMPEDDRKLYFESDYSTFFIVANWFYNLMSYEDVQDVDSDVSNDEDKKIPNKHTQPQSQKSNPKPKAQTHEDCRSGIVVSTYKENGHTYCDLKVEIPRCWSQCEKVKITGIKPNSYPKGGDWYPYCQEVKE